MPAPTYPKRPGHFAHKFCRRLAKATIANELGSDVCWLLATIAHTEDAKGYRDAVLYFNGQLMAFCGFTSEKKLARVRAKAVAAGWLHYEPGRRGTAGRYWVLTPPQHATWDDLPSDERADKYEAADSPQTVQPCHGHSAASRNGQPSESESQYPKIAGATAGKVGGQPPGNRRESGGTTAGQVSTSSSLHQDLHLHQDTPLPPAEPGGGEEGEEVTDFETFEVLRPEPLRELIAEWDAAGLPGHGKIQETSGRRGQFQTLQRDARWRASWRDAVRRMGRSAKCMGRHPTFMVGGARIDTFLKDSAWVFRVLEGEFDDPPSAAAPAEPPPSFDEMTRRLREKYERQQAREGRTP